VWMAGLAARRGPAPTIHCGASPKLTDDDRPASVTDRPVNAKASQFGEGPGVYGYWFWVRSDMDRLPPDARLVRISSPTSRTT
jgi:hypothetical protein